MVARGKATFSTPVRYSGISFYQSRFRRASRLAKFDIIDKNGTIKTFTAKPGSLIKLHESPWVDIRQFSDKGVELKVISKNDSSDPFWITMSPAKSFHTVSGLKLRFNGFLNEDITRLNALYQPGKWWLWAGFIGMLSGFTITFLHILKKVLVVIESHEKGYRITIAGTANKNIKAFKASFNSLCREIKKLNLDSVYHE